MDLEKILSLAGTLGMTKEEALSLYERENARLREIAQEDERKAARDKEILELKIRLAETQRNSGVEHDWSSSGGEPSRSPKICPRKLMAPFDEKRDDLDAYLQRFERIATGQGWDRSEWATALSLCLVGEALSVFGRMPASDSMDYEKVKKTLLQRFRLTAEGFRERFRACRPEDSETGKQFILRLNNYFEWWMEVSDTEKSYAEVLRTNCRRTVFVLLQYQASNLFEGEETEFSGRACGSCRPILRSAGSQEPKQRKGKRVRTRDRFTT